MHDITWNGYTLFSPESMIDDLVAFARSWRPDLVVWDEITFAGSVAARACGAPHARLLIGVDRIRDAEVLALRREVAVLCRVDPKPKLSGLIGLCLALLPGCLRRGCGPGGS